MKLTGTGDYTGALSRSFKILPGRVTGMSTSRTTTTITMNWKQVPGAAVYRVYQSTSANGNYSKVATVSGTKAKISKLSAGKKYYFKIAACGKKDGSYAGPLSAVLNTGTRPSTVSMKSVTKSGTNLKIRWNKVTCSGYEVRYSTDKKMKKGVKTVKITKSSATSTTIKKLKGQHILCPGAGVPVLSQQGVQRQLQQGDQLQLLQPVCQLFFQVCEQ